MSPTGTDLLLTEILTAQRAIRDDQVEHGKALARVDERTAATAAQVEDLSGRVDTADARARKALALHDANQLHHQECAAAEAGNPEAPGWLWRATPQALAMRYPGRAGMVMLGTALVPTVLALVLMAVAGGPAGGLRILLQQAGIRAVYVPTPEPVAPHAPLVPGVQP